MSGTTIVALVSLIGFIVLVVSSGEMRRMTTERKALFAVIWCIVIAVAAFIATRLGLHH